MLAAKVNASTFAATIGGNARPRATGAWSTDMSCARKSGRYRPAPSPMRSFQALPRCSPKKTVVVVGKAREPAVGREGDRPVIAPKGDRVGTPVAPTRKRSLRLPPRRHAHTPRTPLISRGWPNSSSTPQSARRGALGPLRRRVSSGKPSAKRLDAHAFAPIYCGPFVKCHQNAQA